MRYAIFLVWLCGICLVPIAWVAIFRAYWGRKDQEIERNLRLIAVNVLGITWNVAAMLLMRLVP